MTTLAPLFILVSVLISIGGEGVYVCTHRRARPQCRFENRGSRGGALEIQGWGLGVVGSHLIVYVVSM